MEVALILLIGHFLGDFTLQPTLWATKKYKEYKFLVFHIATYALILGLVLFLSEARISAWRAWLLIVIAHYFIDRFKIWYSNKKHRSGLNQLISFCADQMLHLLSIGVAYLCFDLSANTTNLFVRICSQYPVEIMARYLLLFILLMSPASVFIKKLTAYISADERESEYIPGKPSPGSLIGKLERLIIAMFVIFDEVSGIGIVLAAKSFARYKQFEKQEFTEKFLVGTLASMAIAIFLTFILV